MAHELNGSLFISTQVFFRAGALGRMEDARDEKIADKIVAFQAYCKGFVSRKRLEKLKVSKNLSCQEIEGGETKTMILFSSMLGS